MYTNPNLTKQRTVRSSFWTRYQRHFPFHQQITNKATETNLNTNINLAVLSCGFTSSHTPIIPPWSSSQCNYFNIQHSPYIQVWDATESDFYTPWVDHLTPLSFRWQCLINSGDFQYTYIYIYNARAFNWFWNTDSKTINNGPFITLT